MAAIVPFPAEAVTGDTIEVVWRQYPVKAFIVSPAGDCTGTIGLTDIEGANLQLITQLAEHGHVIAYDARTGQTLFDSREPRLAWPDRPDPIAGQTDGYTVQQA